MSLCHPIHSTSVYGCVSAGPISRAAQGVGLGPLAYCDYGFESHRGHERLSVVIVLCCQVGGSATR